MIVLIKITNQNWKQKMECMVFEIMKFKKSAKVIPTAVVPHQILDGGMSSINSLILGQAPQQNFIWCVPAPRMVYVMGKGGRG